MPESRERPPPSFLSAVGVVGQYDISYGEEEQKKNRCSRTKIGFEPSARGHLDEKRK